MKKLLIVNFDKDIVWYDMINSKNVYKVYNFVKTFEERSGQEIDIVL